MQPFKVCTLNTELPILKWDDINFDCPRRAAPGRDAKTEDHLQDPNSIVAMGACGGVIN